MTQQSVTNFFGKRKAVRDDMAVINKKLKCDDKVGLDLVTKGFSTEKERAFVQKPKVAPNSRNGRKGKGLVQVDIRQCVGKLIENKPKALAKEQDLLKVVDQKAYVEPSNKCDNENLEVHKTPVKQGPSSTLTDDLIRSANELVNKLKTQNAAREQGKGKKLLSLNEIKEKIKTSSKLSELKKSINKINEQTAELLKADSAKKCLSPKLLKFTSLEFEYTSPVKNSPSKISSPVKVPAYQRFASLVESSSLPLPPRYQRLLELFEAVDQICSMIRHRGEMITFRKLQPAVQEMTRMCLTERSLGQMAALCPQLFTFRQEKLKNYGSTSKVDRYELVVDPVITAADGRDLTPKLLKARKLTVYNALLEETKKHHMEFLASLDPPVVINEAELKRWHPEFMLHSVPDVAPVDLPQPPTSEGPLSARDILERARGFTTSSARMLNALEAASKESPQQACTEVPPQVKKAVDSRLGDPLKGVPSSLLERVRAKQAARALDTMRMTPQQEKEALMYTRLPEFTRIVRTLFVDEQKSVLPWQSVLDKIQFSYNRNISKAETEQHLKLLVSLLPEWLSVGNVRNGTFIKMNRTTNACAIMEKLNKIVADKKKIIT